MESLTEKLRRERMVYILTLETKKLLENNPSTVLLIQVASVCVT